MKKYVVFIVLINSLNLADNSLLSQDYFEKFITDSVIRPITLSDSNCTVMHSYRIYPDSNKKLLSKTYYQYDNAGRLKKSIDSGVYSALYVERNYSYFKDYTIVKTKTTIHQNIQKKNKYFDTIFDTNRHIIRTIKYFYKNDKVIKKIKYLDSNKNLLKTTSFLWRKNRLIEKQKNYTKDKNIVRKTYKYSFEENKIDITENNKKIISLLYKDNTLLIENMVRHDENLTDKYIYNKNNKINRIELYRGRELIKIFTYNCGCKGNHDEPIISE